MESRFGARIVCYADDFVILCRHGVDEARREMEELLAKLKLTVNADKTRTCRVPEESFDFLGYTIGRCYSPKTGQTWIGVWPAKKRVARVCRSISEMTAPAHYGKPVETMVHELNTLLRGLGNYFCLGRVSRSYHCVDDHARHRLRQWLNGKHRSRGYLPVRYSAAYLHHRLGLVALEKTTSNFSWAKT